MKERNNVSVALILLALVILGANLAALLPEAQAYILVLHGSIALAALIVAGIGLALSRQAAEPAKAPAAPAPEAPRPAPEPPKPAPVAPLAAPAPVIVDRDDVVKAELVHLLALMQEKGRLIDFVMDDITPYTDAQVGAAARVVHQGVGSLLKGNFDITPVQPTPEGGPVTLQSGYPADEFRLVGKVAGQPPFKGTLLHKGWKATAVKLPRLVRAGDTVAKLPVLAPAEVELK